MLGVDISEICSCSTFVMATIETFRALALSFPETVGLPHFDLTSFRIKKKIFAFISKWIAVITQNVALCINKYIAKINFYIKNIVYS